MCLVLALIVGSVGLCLYKRWSAITSLVAAGLLMLASGPHWPSSANGWATMGAIVILATVVPMVTFFGGLERIGPTNAALLSTLEPAVTVLLAARLLGESLKPLSLVGGSLILLAVVLLTRHELRRQG